LSISSSRVNHETGEFQTRTMTAAGSVSPVQTLSPTYHGPAGGADIAVLQRGTVIVAWRVLSRIWERSISSTATSPIRSAVAASNLFVGGGNHAFALASGPRGDVMKRTHDLSDGQRGATARRARHRPLHLGRELSRASCRSWRRPPWNLGNGVVEARKTRRLTRLPSLRPRSRGVIRPSFYRRPRTNPRA
jgi:hypothetical protein